MVGKKGKRNDDHKINIKKELYGVIKRQGGIRKVGLFAIPIGIEGDPLDIQLSSFVYNDFDPKQDDYERVEVRVTTSSCEYEVKKSKGVRLISLIQPKIFFVIDHKAQRERFKDKDWGDPDVRFRPSFGPRWP